MSDLVVFTNRSGSTMLSDILAYANKNINLGELHSCVRMYNYNTPENRQTSLFKQMRTSLTGTYYNGETRGGAHIGYGKARNQRNDIIKQSQHQWTAKEQTDKQSIDINFIDYCCKNGVNIYMTHRQNIVAQYISMINARYRTELAPKSPEWAKDHSTNESQFIFTNKDVNTRVQYNEATVYYSWLHLYTNIFIEQLMMWRIVYEKFKPYVKLVSYEDCIEPMDFSSIGISQSVVKEYKLETKRLVPTPHNTTKIIVQDDHNESIVKIGAWQQALYYVDRHKYLVEV
jgi:hypothetical protein